jgi:hypothetical protein
MGFFSLLSGVRGTGAALFAGAAAGAAAIGFNTGDAVQTAAAALDRPPAAQYPDAQRDGGQGEYHDAEQKLGHFQCLSLSRCRSKAVVSRSVKPASLLMMK